MQRLLLVLLVMALTITSIAHAQEEASSINMIILIDSSGSLIDSQTPEVRRAVETLLKGLSSNDQVAIFLVDNDVFMATQRSFGTPLEMDLRRSLDDFDRAENARKAIDYRSRRTFGNKGLRVALSYASSMTKIRQGSVTVVVYITDGYDEPPKGTSSVEIDNNWATASKIAHEDKIRTWVVGFGDGQPLNIVDKLKAGIDIKVDSASQLTTEMEKIRSQLRLTIDWQISNVKLGRVRPGETREFVITHDAPIRPQLSTKFPEGITCQETTRTNREIYYTVRFDKVEPGKYEIPISLTFQNAPTSVRTNPSKFTIIYNRYDWWIEYGPTFILGILGRGIQIIFLAAIVIILLVLTCWIKAKKPALKGTVTIYDAEGNAEPKPIRFNEGTGNFSKKARIEVSGIAFSTPDGKKIYVSGTKGSSGNIVSIQAIRKPGDKKRNPSTTNPEIVSGTYIHTNNGIKLFYSE